jgi:hypothetical protein
MQNDSTGTDLNRRTFFKGASMASMLALMGDWPKRSKKSFGNYSDSTHVTGIFATRRGFN